MESSEYNDYEGSQAKEEGDKIAPGVGESSEDKPEKGKAVCIDSDDKTRKNIFENIKYDYKMAFNAKTTIDKLITEWNDAYEGKKYGNEMKTRSSIVMRDVAKQIEWQKPNITEPFTASSNPISTDPLNPKSVKPSKIAAAYLNNEFVSNFNRYKFMSDVADVFAREGTVWVRTSWEFEEVDEERHLSNVSIKKIMSIPDEPVEIERNEDGSFDATYRRPKVVKNKPSVEVCRNEHIFPDPGADNKDNMTFICYRFEETIAGLYEAGVYDDDAIKKLEGAVNREYGDTGLGATRDADLQDYGRDDTYQSKNFMNQRVTIVEYWGYADLKDNGSNMPIVSAWSSKHDVLLRLEDNPLPGKRIPFHSAPYASKPFSMWGNSLAYFISDNQKIRTGIMRGVIDNMSLANNGQKFMQRGALDYVNYKRMRNGERYIQTNLDPKTSITDGSFNQLPQSTFSVMQMVSEETKDLSGINQGQPALDTVAQTKTASGAHTQTTMSQQRMADSVRNLSSMMQGVFSDWLAYAKDFIEPDQMMQMFGEYINIEKDDLNGDYNVAIKVSTEMNTQTQISQLNLMLQQAQALGAGAPPGAINKLTAEMMDLFDKPALAKEFREYVPQPDPVAQQMQQLEMQKLQAEIQVMVMKAQAEVMYKKAQSTEKVTKSGNHSMETNLAPQKLASDVALKSKELDQNMMTSLVQGAQKKSED